MTSSQGSPLSLFAEALSKDPVPLDEAALALSAHCQRRTLQLPLGLDALDELAQQVTDPSFLGVTTFLFNELGFIGDNTDYFNPRNSYIDHVIERKLGIPISLAVVVMEVSRRCGVRTYGVGMPGHFLVGDAENSDQLLDPFRGRIISPREAESLFGYVNPSVDFQPEFLAGITNDVILSRMLNNLRLIHVKEQSIEDLICILELMVCWKVPSFGEVKQLGLALDSLGRTDQAARQLDDIAARSDGELREQIGALSTKFWRRLN